MRRELRPGEKRLTPLGEKVISSIEEEESKSGTRDLSPRPWLIGKESLSKKFTGRWSSYTVQKVNQSDRSLDLLLEDLLLED